MSDIFGGSSSESPSMVPPAVARMLEESTGVAPEPPASGEFAVPPALAAAMTVKEEPRVEVPVPPAWTEDHEAAALRSKLAWEKSTRFGKVTVSESEKVSFLKAAIHDKEVTFDVTIGPEGAKTSVKIRSLSNRMMVALSTAMMEDRADGLFGKGEEFDGGYWATRLQLVSMMLQVQSIDLTSVAWMDPDEMDKMTAKELIKALREGASEWGEKLSAPRHALFTTAVSIFEEKVALCRSAMVNGDFSDPAD